ncbi:hypothetical protein [Legionella maioricensis]|uniref:Uncharacterized protein n=1 Tax=Legionella maioricensis TaxID=2896528 RepID=A0A9X2I923_9GAMM|nr:hypothetical protein [Legionella maioricensis]MCL9682745.1 hypothetical protein [Legionella maioricensis]MCL9687207.1 hypothetical protein [Legionella maioricensis]
MLEIDAEDSLDAEHQGDLGSLCMHLFDPLQFEGYTEISIDETQYNKIQFHNLSRELIQTDNAIDYQFRAREFIRQGSALGFTYGFSYWLTRSTSPLIMSKSGNPINDLSVSEPLFCLRSWESNTKMGSIVYRKEDLLHHFYRNQNKKLCVFWPEDPARPVAYTNKCIMKSLIETTSYSSVFVFITVKDIGRELAKALEKGKDRIELPLSIYANPGEAGPFSDFYVGENEVPEEHEIDNVYLGM